MKRSTIQPKVYVRGEGSFKFAFSVYETTRQKDILDYLDDMIETETYYDDVFENDSFTILYNDGRVYRVDATGHDGKYRKRNIKAIVWNNPNDSIVYGDYSVNEYGVVEI